MILRQELATLPTDDELGYRVWVAMRPTVLDLHLQGADAFSTARILAREFAPVEESYLLEMIATHDLRSGP